MNKTVDFGWLRFSRSFERLADFAASISRSFEKLADFVASISRSFERLADFADFDDFERSRISQILSVRGFSAFASILF
ncbi:MAG: hypothetical protein SO487_02070 [Alloprevotella sp.]|nr:hypothetical protein [Alloprevotella sp.]